MPLVKWKFQYEPHQLQERTLVAEMLREWHRASLLWLSVRSLERDGEQVGRRELDRLNLWIAARGAWRCSALPHFEAADVLSDVLSGSVLRVPVGPHGAGRWATRAEFEKLLRDGREGGESETLFDVSKFGDQQRRKVVW